MSKTNNITNNTISATYNTIFDIGLELNEYLDMVEEETGDRDYKLCGISNRIELLLEDIRTATGKSHLDYFSGIAGDTEFEIPEIDYHSVRQK